MRLFGWYIGPEPEPVEKRVGVPIGNATVVEVLTTGARGFYEPKYYFHCGQAMAENPGVEFRSRRVVFADGKYYVADYGLKEITVAPKPNPLRGDDA